LTIPPGAFLPGEPLLMQHNDYDRGLFNGDQGLVLRVQEGHGPTRPVAVFPRPSRESTGGDALLQLDSLRAPAQRRYPMTTHTSQGSEFDYVGVILPDEDLAITTRELLYTAVTRSRRSVVLVGNRQVLEQGVVRQIRRFSGIAERLGPPPTVTP